MGSDGVGEYIWVGMGWGVNWSGMWWGWVGDVGWGRGDVGSVGDEG